MNLFDTLKKDAKSINKIIGTIAFSETVFSIFFDGSTSKLSPECFVTPDDLDIACDVNFEFDESGAITDTCLSSREKLALNRIFPQIDIPPHHPLAVKSVLKTIKDLIELRMKIELQGLNEVLESCHVLSYLTETETYSKQMKVGRYKGLKGEKIIVGKDLVFFYDTEGYCISALPREYVNPLHFCFNTTIK